MLHPAFHQLFCLFFLSLLSAPLAIANGDWTWHGRGGHRSDGKMLELTSQSKENAEWRSVALPVEPGGIYRFDVEMRREKGDGPGCLPCGIAGVHRDYRPINENWVGESFCFRMPDNRKETYLRCAQWESVGTFQFRHARLRRALPVFQQVAALPNAVLAFGDGESLFDGVYTFQGDFNGEGSNYHRPLVAATASFNSNRWCFNAETEAVYRFAVEPYNPLFVPLSTDLVLSEHYSPIPLVAGTLELNICYHAGGEATIDISRDGERWQELGRLTATGTVTLPLPVIAFPAEQIFVRIRGGEQCNLQVDRLFFEATLAETHQELKTADIQGVGRTWFAVADDDELLPGTMANPRFTVTDPEENESDIQYKGRAYSLHRTIHPLHRNDYGYALPADGRNVALWWCEPDWKVSRTRSVPPEETARPLAIHAAKNDREAFQLVLRNTGDTAISGLTAKASAFTGRDGETIPAENVDIRYVYYHFVRNRTDAGGLVDFWPDALPPLERPLDVAPHQNQPIWITVSVPENAAAGQYTGTVRLASTDGRLSTTVPITLHVWNFALPRENRYLETAYGFNPAGVCRYHNATTEADRRQVIDMYFQCFADHRISVYDPAPFDAYKVAWKPDGEHSTATLNTERFDAAVGRAIERFHFTGFRLRVEGLGGGTFHDRIEPKLGGFSENTPEYRAMLPDYLQKLQAHLEAKNLLDKAYVYWFDEPDPKDYPFVAAGLAKLRQDAPKLRRMMTEEPNDEFLAALEKAGTSVDIWCPVSHNFDEAQAAARMAKGERFWWYVCTSPKAPYCTLFIDHPGTELRIWHWQAWQRGVTGSLVWETTYWTSSAAFPKSFQNPYRDPMGYVSGYSTSIGTKRFWGNGDGRFIYPPLEAAVPGMNDGKPILKRPVPSIRWAMIREGVEDYEMLGMLRHLLQERGGKLPADRRSAAERLLQVPEKMTSSMTEFTLDPKPIYERRQEIAAMIEMLSQP